MLLNRPDDLRRVLQYHIVPGAPKWTCLLAEMQRFVAVDGGNLTVKVLNSVTPSGEFGVTVRVTDATGGESSVSADNADAAAANGVVHVVNRVLVWDAGAPPNASLVSMAREMGFISFAAAADASGLTAELDDPGMARTCFVPTDAAFGLAEG
eukprot:gene14723-3056_t